MKIVGLSVHDRAYTIDVDHVASAPARFELRTPWRIEKVDGATVETLTPSSHAIEIAAVPGHEKGAYRRSRVIVTLASTS